MFNRSQRTIITTGPLKGPAIENNYVIPVDETKYREPLPNDGYYYCDRSQLVDAYDEHLIPDGIYYFSIDCVVKVTYVAPTINVVPATSLFIHQLLPNQVGYFLVGSLLGGARKKKMTRAEAANVIKRAARKIKGKGDYGAPAAITGTGAFNLKGFTSLLKSVARGAAKEVRGATRGAANAAVPLMMAGMGSYSPIVTGVGAQAVANQLIANNAPMSKIQSHRDETDGMTITGMEYIGDVYNNTSSNLSGVSYPINPGINFPKLMQLASNYISYDFRQLVFVFKSTVGDATTGNLGNVLMYFSYNAADTPAKSELAIRDYHGGVAPASTQSAILGVECDASKTRRRTGFYVRTTGVASGSITDYDFGQLNVYTSGVPTTVAPNGGKIGNLYAYYTVSLSEPVLGSYLGNLIRTENWADFTSVSASILINSTGVPGVYNNLGGSILSNNTYTFGDSVDGTFTVQLLITGTGFTGNLASPTVTGLVTPKPISGTSYDSAFLAMASSTSAYVTMSVIVAAATTRGGNTMSFPNGSFAGSVTGVTLTITQINPKQSGDPSDGGNL